MILTQHFSKGRIPQKNNEEIELIGNKGHDANSKHRSN